MLKRFLLLALLLDRAVAGRKPCPKGAPLLFCRGQPTKSSLQVLPLLSGYGTTSQVLNAGNIEKGEISHALPLWQSLIVSLCDEAAPDLLAGTLC